MQLIEYAKMPVKPVSFVGNAAVVLIVFFMIVAGAAASIAIYDVLADACSAGCP